MELITLITLLYLAWFIKSSANQAAIAREKELDRKIEFMRQQQRIKAEIETEDGLF